MPARSRHISWALSNSSIVQAPSRVRLFVTLWIVACQALLSFTVPPSMLRFMSIESVVRSNRLIHCCPLLLLPSCPTLEPWKVGHGLDWTDIAKVL